VSTYQIKLEQFEGPLDLLLKLIEEEEMDITKVSLAKVADQFITYVNQSEQLNPGEVADFLVVAAKLLYIKSKMLLPSLAVEDEEADELEKQLKIYKEYYEASRKIKEMLKQNRLMFVREKPLRVFTPKFSPPLGLNLKALSEVFSRVLARLEPIVNLPKDAIKKTISIREKIGHITEMILNKVCLSFKQLLGNKRDKTEIIVSFLAVLELVKQRTIEVEQAELFSEINLKKTEL